jgi:hypothetical protein
MIVCAAARCLFMQRTPALFHSIAYSHSCTPLALRLVLTPADVDEYGLQPGILQSDHAVSIYIWKIVCHFVLVYYLEFRF